MRTGTSFFVRTLWLLAFLLSTSRLLAQSDRDLLYTLRGDTLRGEITSLSSDWILFVEEKPEERRATFVEKSDLAAYLHDGDFVELIEQAAAPASDKTTPAPTFAETSPTEASAPASSAYKVRSTETAKVRTSRAAPARVQTARTPSAADRPALPTALSPGNATNFDRLTQQDFFELEDFKLRESSFVNRYGYSDTTSALIRLFYEKRRNGLSLVFTGLLSSFCVGVVQNFNEPVLEPHPKGIYFHSDKFRTSRAYVGASLNLVTVYGAVKASRYSRKRLLRTLMDYHETGWLQPRHVAQLRHKHFVR